MGDEPGKLGNTALVGWQDVDDRAERGLLDDFVVLRFSATDTDDAVYHGFEGVHGRRIAVELVHDGIRAEHGTNVFGERQSACDGEVETVGVLPLDGFGCPQHDVRPLVDRAVLADSDKEVKLLRRFISDDRCFSHDDGEGDKGRLRREMQLVAPPVLVESRHDSVTLLCHQSVQTFFVRTHPILSLGYCLLVLAQSVADVEVAVTQGHRR